ncbi:MAG: conjugal transfer protein TrbE [Pseudomonadota bacterium]
MLNLSEYRMRPKGLVDYLPWAAFIAPGVVLNKDGSLQRTLRYRGPDLESTGPEERVAYTARVNNALRRFGSGWAMFFEAARRPSTDYPDASFTDAASWLVDEERRHLFEEGGTHFETDCYLTLCWLPPADRQGRLETLMIDDPADAPRSFWEDSLTRFQTETGRAFDLMESLMPEVAWLDDDETLTFLHAAVSTKRHRVRAPGTPMCLDALLCDSALTGGLAPDLGGYALRVVSVQGFPAMTEPGLLGDLDHLGFAYRWVTRFLPMDKPEAEKTLKRYRRQWFAKRKSIAAILKETLENEPSSMVNSDADNKAADADAALQALGADHVSFGYLTTAIAVLHEDPDIADERARAIERVLNGHGFTAIYETVNAVDAWLGTLPGHAYANVRQPIVHSLNLAHMAPLAAVWAGPERNTHLNGPPLLMARSSSGTPFRLSTHQGDVGHTMIVGPTGAGKSVLLSLLALQFQRYDGARIFVFDKGRSARASMLAMGGQDYDLALDGGLSLQPLARINEAAELSFAQSWVLGLLGEEGVELTPAVKEAVWSALSNLAETPREQRTLTGLTALIQSGELRQALQPYTLEGPFGRLLDADEDSLSKGGAATLEMEGLMHEPRLVAPVLAYLFHRLEERFDGAPTLLILDEAWVFLDHPMFAGRLREWLKTLRKKNVSVVFATQSLSDISGSAIAPALIESCPTRIFLPNARAQEPGQADTYSGFGLSDRQTELIARATPKRDYYVQSPAGNRLFDLELGPVALAFCAAGSKADQTAMDDLIQRGEAFAPAWLAYKGLTWAADLILETKEGGVPCAAE